VPAGSASVLRAALSATLVAAAVLVLTAVQSLALAGPASARSSDFASQVRAAERRAAVRLTATERTTPPGRYAYFTSGDRWKYAGAQGWASGYVPGGLWLMYQMTGKDWWRRHAASRQAAIGAAPITSDSLNLGALFFPSYARGFDLTGDSRFRAKALQAAIALAGRYDPEVGAIRSRPAGDFNVIIDSLVGSQLLWWAADHGGPALLREIAARHAATVARDFIRADGSTWQLVSYDDATGAVKLKTTSAGYDADSMWARGQAWAILGFAAAYRETREELFLQAARRVTDRYLADLPADMVPFWDFRDPAIPDAPRDSSAAAIAASGMIDLARCEPDAGNGARYAAAARATISSLMSPTYFSSGADPAVLLHGTYLWRTGTTDRGLAYGDAYFLQALLRLRLLPAEGHALHVARARAAAGTARSAVDGLPGTAWKTRGAQWLELDLGRTAGVAALRLALSRGDTRSARLRVVTSTDRRHWRTAVTTMSSGQTSGFETFAFVSRLARYVRLYVDGTSAGRANAVAAAEVYASR
jgi:unsaturated chondroitin disaccharide hydrolase